MLNCFVLARKKSRIEKSLKCAIPSEVYDKIKRFIDTYGNNASHFNNKIFSLEDAKVAHKIIFDFCLSTFQRIFKSFDKVYEFNLSYLDENKYLTKEEIEDMLKKVKGNEVSTDDVISEIENKGTFITVEQLKAIIEPLNKDISELIKKNYHLTIKIILALNMQIKMILFLNF